MTTTAKKTDPKLWDKVKTEVTEGDKGGKPKQWSARKAQLATAEYKKEGGGYEGGKSEDNHLSQWTKEEWGTKSGEKSGETGERYLPKEAREALKGSEYARSTAKKRADTARGKQFSAQPTDVAKKTAKHRDTGHADGGHSEAGHDKGRHDANKSGKNDLGGMTRQALMAYAAEQNVKGRSRMKKEELVAALS